MIRPEIGRIITKPQGRIQIYAVPAPKPFPIVDRLFALITHGGLTNRTNDSYKPTKDLLPSVSPDVHSESIIK